MAEDRAQQAIDQEMAFAHSIPGIFSEFIRGVVVGECDAKLEFAKFVQHIVSLPNLTLEQKMTIINSEQTLDIGMSRPAATVVDMATVGVSKASYKMSMNVHNIQQVNVEQKVAADVQASVQFGWGLFKGNVKTHASYSRNSDSKRSTDQTAVVDAEVEIARFPAPEGLAKTIDCLNEVAHQGMEINKMLISHQASLATQQVQQSDITKGALPKDNKEEAAASADE